MRKDFLRIPVSLLLAATVLAWNVLPPVLQHRHEEGDDLTHHHDSHDAVALPQDLAHRAHSLVFHGRDHAESGMPELTGSEVSHFHFQWLGLRWTFSDDNGTDSKAPDYGIVKLLVRTGHDPLSQIPRDNRLETPLPQLSLTPTAAIIEAGQPAVSGFLAALPHPLCDRARHERSGVLLA